MLELAILGLLKERAMHGYQLKKRLADTLGSFWQVSYGSLYPGLKRLQREERIHTEAEHPGIRLIEPGQPVPMGRIAETLACDASNVTGLVDRLEARGLVRRQPSEEDRRVKALGLTPTGARLRAVVLERMTKPPDSLSRLSPSEQRSLVRILRRLLD